MPKLVRIINDMPRQIDVRSFYAETISTPPSRLRSRCDQAQSRGGHAVSVQLRQSIPGGLPVLLSVCVCGVMRSGADQGRGVRAADQVPAMSLRELAAGARDESRPALGPRHDLHVQRGDVPEPAHDGDLRERPLQGRHDGFPLGVHRDALPRTGGAGHELWGVWER